MLKKIISIMLAVVMLFSIAAVGAFAAEDGDSVAEENMIYFDATGWKDITAVFCYIWERGGDSFYAWKQKVTSMKPVVGNIYSFDLSLLDKSAKNPGGLKDDKDYCIIFSSSIGVADGAQTYELTFGTECIGDTAYLIDNQIENPVDSEKTAQEAAWTINSDKYGPHMTITSIGNIIGSHFCPNESPIAVIGDWLPSYIYSPRVDVVDTLADAFVEFGIESEDDLDAILEYIYNKHGENISDDDYFEIAFTLFDAFETAYSPEDEEPTDTEPQPTEPSDTMPAPTEPTGTEPLDTEPAVTEPAATEPAATEPAATEPTSAKPTEPKKEVEPAAKKANKMKVTVKTKTVKAKKLKKGKVTVKAITVKNNNGAVTYAKAKKSSKCLTINKKTGKITVKKGTKKGTYKINVKITAKGDKNYNSKTVTKTIKIKVK